jgi:hypothetical protein
MKGEPDPAAFRGQIADRTEAFVSKTIELISQFEASSVDVPHAPSTALMLAELKARVEYLDTMIIRLRDGGDIAEADADKG